MINKNNIYILVIFTGLFFLFGYQVYMHNQTSLYAENGILENIQALVLMISCIIFILPVIYQKREDKFILLFFSLLCFSFFLREVDVEDFNLPSILIFIGSGIGRNIMLTVGFLALFMNFYKNRESYKKLIRVFSFSNEGLLILQSAVFLFIGRYFETKILMPHHVFLEEIFELFGFLSLLFAALFLFIKKGYK